MSTITPALVFILAMFTVLCGVMSIVNARQARMHARIAAELREQQHRMTLIRIQANIDEWRRGCGNTMSGLSPQACEECTLALIEAIEQKVKAAL